jgi:plasmid maintenance system killer protein
VLCRFILSLVLFLAGFSASAKECTLDVALRDPKLANNSQFWDDYSKLKSTENADEVGALLKKYGYSDSSTVGSGSRPMGATAQSNFSRSAQLTIEKKAEKEISALPSNLKSKLDDFVGSMTKPGGVQEVRNNPGRYHLERLSQFGDHAYSIRLNDGYRVLFDMDDAGVVIRRVNKGQIHRN